MLHPRLAVALAASLALTSSVAAAGHEPAKPVADDADETDADAAPTKPAPHHAHGRVALRADASDDTDDTDTDADAADPVAPARLHRKAAAHQGQDWHVALGPYVWAASVDAQVSVGGANVASGIDTAQLAKHTKFGAEALAEARYDRFALTGDLTYGVIGIDAGTSAAGIMATVTGEATSAMFDGAFGYMLAGGDHALLSFEARAGLRYQRTTVKAVASAAGGTLEIPEIVMASKDALAGARVFLRPSARLALSGTADVGVVGDSSSTWSVSVDASARLTDHFLLSAGWRTLTVEGGAVNTTMHGPRVALQLLF